MKQITLIFLIALCLGFSCSLNVKRGNGHIITREFDVDDFIRINAGGNYKINLVHADEPLVMVSMDENLFDYLEVENQGDQLYINSEHNLKPTESIEIEIFYVELEEITSFGASAIEHKEILKSDELSIEMSGAGAIILNLDVDELNINLSGAGAINLEGYVYSQVINLSGAGSLEARELESRYAEIAISGIGNAEVFVRKELEASISGMGNIEYFGNPDVVNQHISGMGKIKKGETDGSEENI